MTGPHSAEGLEVNNHNTPRAVCEMHTNASGGKKRGQAGEKRHKEK